MEEIGHKIRAIEASVYEAVPKKKTCREFVRKNQAPCGKPCRGEVCGYHSHRRRGGAKKEKSACLWIGRNGFLCGRSCFGQYCGQHNFVYKKRGNLPLFPCMVCGRGVENRTGLCKNCGRDRVRMRIYWDEKRGWRNCEVCGRVCATKLCGFHRLGVDPPPFMIGG